MRAASAVAAFGDGWLIAQDDKTMAAWWRGDRITRVRLFPPVQGHDAFSEADGTKPLKPDLEGACPVETDVGTGVLLLGSGSLPTRMRAAVAYPGEPECTVVTASLAPLYERVATALGIEGDQVNMEGACVLGTRLRWFQRGHPASDVPSSSVDVDVEALLSAMHGHGALDEVVVSDVRRYEFSSSGDVAPAITDAAVLPDGRILVSLAAEDTPDAVADGEVVGAALAVLDDQRVVGMTEVPPATDGAPRKVEGLAVRGGDSRRVDVLAVVDADDPSVPSAALDLDLEYR